MKTRKIAGALGAELTDVSLSSELTPERAREIRAALLEHQVIFFRDRPLSPAGLLGFARAMGTPIDYPFVKGIEGLTQEESEPLLQFLFRHRSSRNSPADSSGNPARSRSGTTAARSTTRSTTTTGTGA